MENNKEIQTYNGLYLKLEDVIPVKGLSDYLDRTQKTSSEHWPKIMNRLYVLAVANAVLFTSLPKVIPTVIDKGLEALVRLL